MSRKQHLQPLNWLLTTIITTANVCDGVTQMGGCGVSGCGGGGPTSELLSAARLSMTS